MPEDENAILEGVIDFHVHSRPDTVERIADDLELALEAKEAGMHGIVLKAHGASTVERAYLASRAVRAFDVFGGVCLNASVGGLNPELIKRMIQLKANTPSGQRVGMVVWLPTLDAENHIAHGSHSSTPVPVRVKGDPAPGLIEILKLVGEYNLILATGHLSSKETLWVIDLAKSLGVNKIVVNHPEFSVTRMTLEDQEAAAEKGAFLEHCYYPLTPVAQHVRPEEIVKSIKQVGAGHCILASDLGQYENVKPIEGLRSFIRTLLHYGLTWDEIKLMTKTNPAALLYS
ncbi:DUF6282 family protein [Gelria sp. Kuro-4]|jgi:hypothetical protein|uniref:DUF6282 family protein n=1 Tax=Gelria sp. Kuro-4 TaxID=2796927 RepID=UPI001BEDD784|nr:DUF6282 family protein [Gelria sp. Kuro-4]BCV24180.1 hypothetical protein kuro4_09530 [Gelria sp. Kuro-4]